MKNFLAHFLYSEQAFKGYQILQKSAHRSSLCAIERYVVCLSACYFSGCEYAMAMQTFLSGHDPDMDLQWIASLRVGDSPDEKRLAALHDYVLAFYTKNQNLSWQTSVFLSQGFSVENVMEVILILSMMKMEFAIHQVFQTPLDEELENCQWQKRNRLSV